MVVFASLWASPCERSERRRDQPDTAAACRADTSAGWSGLLAAGLKTVSRAAMMLTTSAMSPPPRKQVLASVLATEARIAGLVVLSSSIWSSRGLSCLKISSQSSSCRDRRVPSLAPASASLDFPFLSDLSTRSQVVI